MKPYPYSADSWARLDGQRCADCGEPFQPGGPLGVFTLGGWRHLRACMAAAQDKED